jgi:subtilisin family serine protease
MKYLDKSTGRSVELNSSKTDYLVLVESEAEALEPILTSSRTFWTVKSTNKDNVFILSARSQGESVASIEKELAELQQDKRLMISPALIDSTGATRFVLPRRVVVQLNFKEHNADNIVATVGGQVIRRFLTPGLYEFQTPDGIGVDEFIEQLNAVEQVKFAEPSFYGVDDQDFNIRISTVRGSSSEEETAGTSPVLGWNLQKLDVATAWEVTRGSANILVFVVDGLPDINHEAISRKFIAPLDISIYFTADRSVSSHATYVASTIAGESAQMVGVAPSVRLLPLVVNLSSQTYAERADALRFAVELAQKKTFNGAVFLRMVMCCSWKTAGDIAVIRSALEEVVAAGILPVFSAGNDGTAETHFPSDYASWDGPLGDAILSVAATDENDQRAEYSNYSHNVSVFAPGGDGLPLDQRDILCAEQGNTYAYAAGTSIAAPHVAAVAALVLSINPDLPVKEVKKILLQSVDGAVTLGVGRLSAIKAVTLARATLSSVARTAVGEPVETGSSGDKPMKKNGVLNLTVTTTIPTDLYTAVRERLRECGTKIETDTGWAITEMKLVNGEVKTVIDLT